MDEGCYDYCEDQLAFRYTCCTLHGGQSARQVLRIKKGWLCVKYEGTLPVVKLRLIQEVEFSVTSREGAHIRPLPLPLRNRQLLFPLPILSHNTCYLSKSTSIGVHLRSKLS